MEGFTMELSTHLVATVTERDGTLSYLEDRIANAEALAARELYPIRREVAYLTDVLRYVVYGPDQPR
jgi:hypothetical protein